MQPLCMGEDEYRTFMSIVRALKVNSSSAFALVHTMYTNSTQRNLKESYQLYPSRFHITVLGL